MGLRRFRMDLSREWQDRTPYAIEAPPVDGRRTQLVVETAAAADRTLEQFAAERIARTRAARGDLEVIRQGPVDLGGGRTALTFAYRFWIEGAALHGQETFVAQDDRLFAFSAQFDEITYPAYGEQVAAIVASLSPAPPGD